MTREEAIAILEDIIETYRNDEENKDWAEACSYAINLIVTKARINNAPTIDAEPLKHGEWIFNPTDAIDLMFAKPKCSKCGFESSDGGNYCSNCGAKMDGGKE